MEYLKQTVKHLRNSIYSIACWVICIFALNIISIWSTGGPLPAWSYVPLVFVGWIAIGVKGMHN